MKKTRAYLEVGFFFFLVPLLERGEPVGRPAVVVGALRQLHQSAGHVGLHRHRRLPEHVRILQRSIDEETWNASVAIRPNQ